MPLTSKTFSQLIDFTRTSAATYVDQLGRIVPTPVSPNLLTFTQEVDNAAWSKSGTSVTAEAGLAPDGTLTADKVAETAVTAVHNCGQSITTTNALHTFTVHLRAAERTFAMLYHTQTNSGVGVNLLTGETGTPSGLSTPTSVSVTSTGSGWYRVSMTVMATAASNFFGIYTMTSLTGSSNFAGTAGNGIFVWGAQLEQTPDANLTLGSELVTNGDFASGSTGWTLDTGITVTSNQLVGATTSNQHLRQSIGSVGSRVYRVSMTVVSYTSGSPFITIGAGTQAYIPSPSVTGTKTFYVVAGGSDALFRFYPGEFGIGGTITVDNISVREVTAASPSTYTRNFGGRFPPRFDYDPVTLSPRGLLIEEQRTNVLVRSEELDHTFWSKSRTTVTPNAATSPDGTVDADKLIEDTAAGTHRVFQQATKAASVVTRTFSVYLKAAERTLARITVSNNNEGVTTSTDINLSTGTATAASTPQDGTISGQSASIINAGNGWYRCIITATLDASITTPGAFIFLRDGSGNFSYTGNGTSGIFVWGAQWEDGAFATSYIPTVASQVTRTADSAAITGANFSPWYNPVEGTMVCEWSPYVEGAFTPLSITDGSFNNRIQLSGYNTIQFLTSNGGATQAILDAGSITGGAVNKVAGAYRVNDFAASTNGSGAVTDTSGTIPTVNRLSIGNLSGIGEHLNGHIRSIRYYPTRLTNAQLQALTA